MYVSNERIKVLSLFEATPHFNYMSPFFFSSISLVSRYNAMFIVLIINRWKKNIFHYFRIISSHLIWSVHPYFVNVVIKNDVWFCLCNWLFLWPHNNVSCRSCVACYQHQHIFRVLGSVGAFFLPIFFYLFLILYNCLQKIFIYSYEW